MLNITFIRSVQNSDENGKRSEKGQAKEIVSSQYSSAFSFLSGPGRNHRVKRNECEGGLAGQIRRPRSNPMPGGKEQNLPFLRPSSRGRGG